MNVDFPLKYYVNIIFILLNNDNDNNLNMFINRFPFHSNLFIMIQTFAKVKREIQRNQAAKKTTVRSKINIISSEF